MPSSVHPYDDQPSNRLLAQHRGKPLAIFVRRVGIVSETFIQRHIEQLLPDQVVVVALDDSTDQGGGHWTVDAPTLVLSHVQAGFRVRLAHKLRTWLRLPSTLMNPLAIQTRAIRQFLTHHQVQVILAEYLDLFLDWLPLAQDLGIRFFAHAHGYDVTQQLRAPHWQRAYLRYNQADGVVTMSQVSRHRLIALGLNPNKVHAVPYGVEVPSQPPRRPTQETVRCLAVGRMVPKKSPICLLDAFRRAVAVYPALRLDYVGTGALFPAARDFVAVMGLADFVTFHDKQPNSVVQALMQSADIFVQHSKTDPATGDEEGLPVAILEAMAAGLPIVATHHAGIPEEVVEGETGFLVPEGDTIAMAERIVTLAQDAELRHTLGQAGWQRALDMFTWEQERKSLLELMGLSALSCSSYDRLDHPEQPVDNS
ncbi:MAG: glycosyltransferase family 4 protein [Cyanobacteria bacterium]|nr:glycosyltransferase family 4 protein [Cyanobacteriota bacterium]MDW8202196.1 glycosyltransferase family 4 protein [Cyanobacteriota bacterium SKYGB_h_bin112]